MELKITDLKKTYKPLFWCGIFVGIGFASKWNVAYGFIGIAVLFFMNIMSAVIRMAEA